VNSSSLAWTTRHAVEHVCEFCPMGRRWYLCFVVCFEVMCLKKEHEGASWESRRGFLAGNVELRQYTPRTRVAQCSMETCSSETVPHVHTHVLKLHCFVEYHLLFLQMLSNAPFSFQPQLAMTKGTRHSSKNCILLSQTSRMQARKPGRGSNAHVEACGRSPGTRFCLRSCGSSCRCT
jgi:hypothetical protein